MNGKVWVLADDPENACVADDNGQAGDDESDEKEAHLGRRWAGRVSRYRARFQLVVESEFTWEQDSSNTEVTKLLLNAIKSNKMLK